MTATLGSFPVFRALDADGAPLVGGLLYSYAAGTLTPLATYVDAAGVTTNANPVVLDSTGSANVWFGSSAYKLVLKTSTGSTLWTVDNYQPESAAATLRSDLASTASTALGDALVGVKSALTGGTARTQHGKNADTVSVKDFGAVGDGVWSGTAGDSSSTATGTDDTAAFYAALASGAKRIKVPAGVYIVTGGFSVADNIWIEGDGMVATTLYLKSGSNSIMFQNSGGSGTGGTNVKFSGLTLHGNQYRDVGHAPANLTANTDSPGFFRNCLSGTKPSLIFRDVHITSFYGDASFANANEFYGSGWLDWDNVHIKMNYSAIGARFKCSDSIIKGLYTQKNGEWASIADTVIQAGGDNRFIGCYFGGGGCSPQVLVIGSSSNQFIGCTNDNTYGDCYQFNDFGGLGSNENLILGGSASNAGQSVAGGSSWGFYGASSDNLVIGCKSFWTDPNGTSIKPKYGAYEGQAGDTAARNILTGCYFDTASNYATAQVSLRAGSGSKVLDSNGYRAVGFCGAIYTTAATQSLTQNAFTIINFDSKDFDTDSAVTTGASWKFTAPSNGVYTVNGCVSWTGASTTVTQVAIFKGGVEAKLLNQWQQSMGAAGAIPYSGSIQLTAGEYIDLRVYVGSASMTLQNYAYANHISILRMANS